MWIYSYSLRFTLASTDVSGAVDVVRRFKLNHGRALWGVDVDAFIAVDEVTTADEQDND